MKKILTIIIVLMSINICSQDTNSAKYFPLKTGNKWFYYVTELGYPSPTYNIKTLRVLNDTIVNSKKYFKVKGYPFSNIGDTNIILIRYDSVNGLLKQSTIWAPCNYESILFRLSSQIGDTTGVCYSDWQYTCLNISDTFLFNQPTNVKAFGYFINGHNTASYHHNFLKNIGLHYISRTSTGNQGIYGRIAELRGFVLNGIVYGDTSSVIGISIISSNVPERFSLSQNYPNPFNPSTKIKFSIPLSKEVTAEGSRGVFVNLKIYDVMGRVVETLHYGELKSGIYKADWNASNFPSGVYFYNLTAGNFTETKKMILIK
ncbi:MAG: T9SS type A sorting domain-containing protein [Ignavibacteria bacterium]|nr:T9SS type A sorting domain-containing protein [Ignavibacteria bacterium]